nr:hypothetical protein [Tolivirales sp.]
MMVLKLRASAQPQLGKPTPLRHPNGLTGGGQQEVYAQQLASFYKLRNLERAYGVRTVVRPLTVHSEEEESMYGYLKRECLPTITQGLATLERFFCCGGFKDDMEYRDTLRQQAESAIDGPDQLDYYHPTDYLELAPNVFKDSLRVVGHKMDTKLSGYTIGQIQHQVIDDVVSGKPNILVGRNHCSDAGFVRIEPSVVEANFVIRKGKKMFYCNSLLRSVRAVLGRELPMTDLSRKVVRRHTNKLCDIHGLRPRDKQLAVEVVVRLYWHRSRQDTMIDDMVEEYEEVRLCVVKRLYRRLKRYVMGRPSNSLYTH